MDAVVAGAVAGYAMGLLAVFWCTWLLYVLVRDGRIDRLLEGGAVGGLAAAILGGVPVGFIIAGTAAGAAYALLEADRAPGFLGSPSAPFTGAMVLIAWLPLPILVAAARRWWWFYGPLCVLFAVLFGWGIPVLTELQ